MRDLGEIIIEGGRPLRGSVKIQGSKNAVLPMMAAAVLHEGQVILHGCPKIADVFSMEHILRSLGARTRWEEDTLHISCEKISGTIIDEASARSMRSSVILMGSMLGRTGNICVSYPGGCTIGKRPIDLHLHTLSRMGAHISQKGDVICASCPGGLSGASISFPLSSVGATENGILAAVKAKGTTILENCALEPEIFHLCRFLQAMGAEIGGIGTRKLQIRGVRILRNAEVYIPADRIVAGTYLYAAAATRGKIQMENPPMEEIASILQVYEKMGGQWERIGGKLLADASRVGVQVPATVTECYPGFPTDMQSVLMAVLLTIPGKARIRESIFEDRFRTVEEFVKLGGKITVKGRDAFLEGGNPLTGTEVRARDLRGGAALAAAGLAARGTTVIRDASYIERGYQALDRDLAGLGARIRMKR